MSFEQYQLLAARTIRTEMSEQDLVKHAMLGIVSQVGQFCDLYKDELQNDTPVDEEHAKKQLGDLLWFIAQMCTANGWDMGQVAHMNIEKLKKRFPNGFNLTDDLNRKSGDV